MGLREQITKNQCVAIHSASCLIYTANKRTRTPPSRSAANQLGKEIRFVEFNDSVEMRRTIGPPPKNIVVQGINSIAHIARRGNHGIDYRGYRPVVMQILNGDGRSLRIFDIVSNSDEIQIAKLTRLYKRK